jgi:hypothetical protein
MPKLDGIVETAIHTEDMVRSRAFYELAGVLEVCQPRGGAGILARAARAGPLSCPRATLWHSRFFWKAHTTVAIGANRTWLNRANDAIDPKRT